MSNTETALSDEQAARALLATARHFLKFGNCEATLVLLDGAEALGLKDPSIDALRSEALLRTGAAAEAVAAAERALSAPERPWHARLRLLHVAMLKAAGRVAEARARVASLTRAMAPRKHVE